jgi:polysaccharide export outer membrane protein
MRIWSTAGMGSFLRQANTISLGLLLCLITTSGLMADEQAPELEYQLSVGDKLRITVYGHEDLSGEFEIDSTGNISLPLAGDIKAAGGTANDLEASIVDALRPDYLKNPRISAELLNYRPFYIFGEVKTPGSYPYTSGMTVISAVAVAGGFTYRARKNRITIQRGKDDDQVELEADDDTQIRPGDVIEVPERFF